MENVILIIFNDVLGDRARTLVKELGENLEAQVKGATAIMGQKVLVSAPTNVAVDSLCEKVRNRIN